MANWCPEYQAVVFVTLLARSHTNESAQTAAI